VPENHFMDVPDHGRKYCRDLIFSREDGEPDQNGEGGPERTKKKKWTKAGRETEWGRLPGGSEGLQPLTSRGWDAADNVAVRQIRLVIYFVAQKSRGGFCNSLNTYFNRGTSRAGRWMMLRLPARCTFFRSSCGSAASVL